MGRGLSHVKKEIRRRNPWYTDDQFEAQFGNPASRHVILNRWRLWKEYIHKWLINYSGQVDKIRVLDAGCGDGINLLGLKQILENLGAGFVIYGMDYNLLRLKRAANLNEKWLCAGSLLNAPVENKRFDIILCNQVLEHIKDDIAALNELKRMLKDSGFLILGVPNEGCFMAQLRNRFIQPSISRTTDHVHFYTDKTFRKRLKDAGLELVSCEREGFFFPHMAINQVVGRYKSGRALIKLLNKLLPSQAAGLIVGCRTRKKA